ncbi:MAG: cache domain-containing protein [Cupriavidus sp.]|nr:cache domain-containing protein [Cupriavidus sp.]
MSIAAAVQVAFSAGTTAIGLGVLLKTPGAAESHFLGVLIVAIQTGLTACAAWWLMRKIVYPIEHIEDIARNLAAGDLTNIDWDKPAGALCELQSAMHAISEIIFKIVLNVRSGTAALATTSGFISADNKALLESTNTQASALEATASTMEQLTATVQTNATNSDEAYKLSTQAAGAAQNGGDATAKVVSTMTSIMEASKRVVEIISVIDSIAFQTNILALNAAVEAARAGEQGRGFAVVAGEVRSLAQRSASAAKEIKELINTSVSRINDGNEQVSDTGVVISDVVRSIENLANLMADISAATNEQSAGIVAVNDAMAKIDTMTQKNNSLVEESAKTAVNLIEQANHLAGLVAGIKLGAKEFGSKEEAVGMVKEAVQFASAHGTGALVEEVRQLNKGRFIDRDLYCSIYDLRANCLANGANPRYIGINGNTFKDSDGKFFVKEIVSSANRSGSGWVDYKHPHPLTREFQPKTTYFERVGDIVVSCGFYTRSR